MTKFFKELFQVLKVLCIGDGRGRLPPMPPIHNQSISGTKTFSAPKINLLNKVGSPLKGKINKLKKSEDELNEES